MPLVLNTPIIKLHEHGIANISSAMARKLAAAVANHAAKSDVADATVGDLLNYYPTRYEDRSNFIGIDKLYDGSEASVELFTRVSGGFQVGKNRSPRQPKLYIFEISAGDRDRVQKPVVIFWFVSGKQSGHVINYYKDRFTRGTRFVAFGRWEWDSRRNTFALKLSKPDELEMLPPLEESSRWVLPPMSKIPPPTLGRTTPMTISKISITLNLRWSTRAAAYLFTASSDRSKQNAFAR